MARQIFSLKQIRNFDYGTVSEMFDRRMLAAAADCASRPHVKTAREVHLVMRMVPVPEIRGSTIDLDSVEVQFEVRAKTPSERSLVIAMDPTAAGLAYNPDDPAEPEAKTLFDEQERAEDAIESGGAAEAEEGDADD